MLTTCTLNLTHSRGRTLVKIVSTFRLISVGDTVYICGNITGISMGVVRRALAEQFITRYYTLIPPYIIEVAMEMLNEETKD